MELGIATHGGYREGARLGAVDAHFGALGVTAETVLCTLLTGLCTLCARVDAGFV